MKQDCKSFVSRACLLALWFLPITARAQFTMAPPPAPVLSNQTGLFHQPVQVTNAGTQPRSDLRLFVSGLVAPVVLHNATGTLNNTPYLDYTTAIAPGATATVELRYYDPTLRMLSTPLVTIGSPNPEIEIAITTPAAQARLVTSPVTVTGTVSSGVNSIAVNSRPATITGTAWSILLPMHQGTNVITATATSSTGQLRSATRTVFLETAPPAIAVAFPADGSRVTESSIAVSGVINDVVPGTINAGQITVTVNGLAARVANRTFSLPAVPLQPGLNNLVVVGSDPEGNTSTQTVRVTYLVPEGNAVVRIVSGGNQTGAISQELPQPLVVKVQNADGSAAPNVPVAFRVKCNDGFLKDGARTERALVVNTGASGLAQVRWVLGSRSGAGCNVIEATATGYAGRADFIAEGLPGPAFQINVEANNNQVGQAGQPLRQPLFIAVTDGGYNRKSGVPVTFTVTEGGGVFDNGLSSFTANTNSDGRASVRLVLGSGSGPDNNRVTANFAGNPGLPAIFVASGFTPGPPQNTAVTGVVLDNTDQPIEGVTLSISGTALTTTSNAEGQFRLQGVPVGHVQFTANGSTALRPGTWPTLEYEMTTVSGRDNTLGMPIYLLPLDLTNGVPVTETTGGVLTLPNYPGFKLEIAPGSVTFPGGSRSGLISVTAVHADKVPMTPGFGQQPRFIVTVQPVNSIFDPPAKLTLPNSDSLAPGAITEMYSFDHDIRQFVAIGTGHVSEDGSVIVSDPGIGIVKAGWHCGGNPQEVAAGMTSTVSVDKATINKCQDQVTATGSPTPPHDPGPFEWMKDTTGIAAADQGDLTFTVSGSGATSTATITGVRSGRVNLKVRYRCKSAQWSAYKTIAVTVPKVTIEEDLRAPESVEYGSLYGFDTFTERNTNPPFAYMSLENGRSDTVKAVFQPAAAFEGVGFESSSAGSVTVSPATAASGNQILTVTGAGVGQSIITAKCEANELGKINVKSYTKLTKTVAVTLIHEKASAAGDAGYTSTDVSDVALERALRVAYKQAVIEWTIVRKPAKTVEFDLNNDGQIDVNSWMSAEMTPIRDAAGTAEDFNIFLVDNPTDNSLGFMSFNQKYGFMHADNINGDALVIAHELGHGQGLQHTPADADNLMHPTNLNVFRLRRSQWDALNP